MRIPLYGRLIIQMEIRAKTGLHIGGSGADMAIGGLDKVVIRDPLTDQPYIPGSSLKGKMRSQLEKLLGLPQHWPIGNAKIHVCRNAEEFQANGGCPVCTVFGVPAELDFSSPTRLVVRDAFLTKKSEEELRRARTDLSYTELKTEVAIDRVTSMANPRTIERVPAGATFAGEIVFSFYEPADVDRVKVLLDGLQLVEDDYLGGNGSRGYGKVEFQQIRIALRTAKAYTQEHPIAEYKDLRAWAADFDHFREQVAALLGFAGG